jgi:hypothetical protein
VTPTLRAALALVATLLVASCSTDTEDPGLQPADTGGTSTSPAPDQEAGTTAGSTEATGDPLTFGGNRTRVTISCFPRGERRMVFYDGVRTDRPVTLTGLTTEASALRITGTYVREVPGKEVDESGVIDLLPGRELTDRRSGLRPLEGADLEPDTRYTFFAVARVVPDARLDDLRLGWADDRRSDASVFDLRGRTRSGGC